MTSRDIKPLPKRRLKHWLTCGRKWEEDGTTILVNKNLAIKFNKLLKVECGLGRGYRTPRGCRYKCFLHLVRVLYPSSLLDILWKIGNRMGDKRNPPSVLQDWRGEKLLLLERHKTLPVSYSKVGGKAFIYLKERKLYCTLRYRCPLP